MILKTIKENKLFTFLTVYFGVLILLMAFVVGVAFLTSATGVIAYYQYAVFSAFCFIFGMPILLFMLFLLFVLIKDSVQSFPSYFMKQKRKMTEMGKKSFKADCSVIALVLFCGLIGLGFTAFGTIAAIDSIQDYQYLEDPASVNLYDVTIGYQSGTRRSFGGIYRLYGYDEEGKEYEFRIGKYPERALPSMEIYSLTVYYLPHSSVVIDIK